MTTKTLTISLVLFSITLATIMNLGCEIIPLQNREQIIKDIKTSDVVELNIANEFIVRDERGKIWYIKCHGSSAGITEKILLLNESEPERKRNETEYQLRIQEIRNATSLREQITTNSTGTKSVKESGKR